MFLRILLSATCMGVLGYAAFMHFSINGVVLAAIGAASAALLLGAGGQTTVGVRDMAVPPALMVTGVLVSLLVEPWLAIPSIVLSGYVWVRVILAFRHRQTIVACCAIIGAQK